MASTLSYRELGLSWRSAPRRVVALGDRTHPVFEPVSVLSSECAIRILDAPRSADPRRFGVPSCAGDWYVEGDEGPDPHAFHLCFAALEQTLLEGSEGTVVLFGAGQGAALCLSLACCWPERLAAVVACDGALPTHPAGGLDERPLAGLPVLCLGAAIESVHALGLRGARLTEGRDWDARRIAAWLQENTGAR